MAETATDDNEKRQLSLCKKTKQKEKSVPETWENFLPKNQIADKLHRLQFLTID